jgi:hypothetical protein
MKVLIEDAERALFFAEGEKWTPFLELACDFKRTLIASDWCKGRQGRTLMIYLAFENCSLNLRIDPLRFTRHGLARNSASV